MTTAKTPENGSNGAQPAMQTPPIVSPEAWESARLQMLVKEKASMRAHDALAAERRRMPWMAVEKSYRFEGPKGSGSLLDLFEGRRQLIIYRAFFEPGVFGWPEHACRGCSLGADQVSHLAYFDDVAVQSATDPDEFRAALERIVADGGISPDDIAEQHRSMSGINAAVRTQPDARGLRAFARSHSYGDDQMTTKDKRRKRSRAPASMAAALPAAAIDGNRRPGAGIGALRRCLRASGGHACGIPRRYPRASSMLISALFAMALFAAVGLAASVVVLKSWDGGSLWDAEVSPIEPVEEAELTPPR